MPSASHVTSMKNIDSTTNNKDTVTNTNDTNVSKISNASYSSDNKMPFETKANPKIEPEATVVAPTRIYNVAAHNLREYNGVPSMTAENLEKTLALLQLRPSHLVVQGLAPQTLLKKKDPGPPLPPMDPANQNDDDLGELLCEMVNIVALVCNTTNSSDLEKEAQWKELDNDSSSSDSNSDRIEMNGSKTDIDNEIDRNNNKDKSSAYGADLKSKANHLTHEALAAGGINLGLGETRPLLRALGVEPSRLVQLGLVEGEALRAIPSRRDRKPDRHQHRDYELHCRGECVGRGHGPSPLDFYKQPLYGGGYSIPINSSPPSRGHEPDRLGTSLQLWCEDCMLMHGLPGCSNGLSNNQGPNHQGGRSLRSHSPPHRLPHGHYYNRGCHGSSNSHYETDQHNEDVHGGRRGRLAHGGEPEHHRSFGHHNSLVGHRHRPVSFGPQDHMHGYHPHNYGPSHFGKGLRREFGDDIPIYNLFGPRDFRGEKHDACRRRGGMGNPHSSHQRPLHGPALCRGRHGIKHRCGPLESEMDGPPLRLLEPWPHSNNPQERVYGARYVSMHGGPAGPHRSFGNCDSPIGHHHGPMHARRNPPGLKHRLNGSPPPPPPHCHQCHYFEKSLALQGRHFPRHYGGFRRGEGGRLIRHHHHHHPAGPFRKEYTFDAPSVGIVYHNYDPPRGEGGMRKHGGRHGEASICSGGNKQDGIRAHNHHFGPPIASSWKPSERYETIFTCI